MTRRNTPIPLDGSRIFDRCLPVRFDAAYPPGSTSRLITTFALQRSGQHLVIDWMCRGLVDALHLNNCRFFREGLTLVLTPLMGRRILYSADSIQDSGVQGRRAYRKSLPSSTPANVVYSFENQSLHQPAAQRLVGRFRPFLLVILRDPANWLASSLRHGLHDRDTLKANINIFKDLLKFVDEGGAAGTNGVTINFNRFTDDESYRKAIAKQIGLSSFERAEEALRHTPDFGGGSSFKGDQGRSNGVHGRYLEYEDDAFFRSALEDVELIQLAQAFFGPLPDLLSR